MARKTIPLQWLIDQVNHFNANSSDEFANERQARNTLLSAALQEVGAYNGFQYLDKHDIGGQAYSVGIREQLPDGSWNFDDTDTTRVKY
ncbi:MAG: hypothetical protein KAJ33_08810 [Thermoplasmata archaeon]|nr:hypothetical protein [Thermoplasmata archaeon]